MTLILAKILGLYFLAIGIAFISNPDRLKSLSQQVMKDDKSLFLGGVIALFIGAFIVSVHNVWVLSWPVIITILGWWSLIKGFVVLNCADCTRWFSFIMQKPTRFFQILGAVYAVLGAFLIYQGC